MVLRLAGCTVREGSDRQIVCCRPSALGALTGYVIHPVGLSVVYSHTKARISRSHVQILLLSSGQLWDVCVTGLTGLTWDQIKELYTKGADTRAPTSWPLRVAAFKLFVFGQPPVSRDKEMIKTGWLSDPQRAGSGRSSVSSFCISLIRSSTSRTGGESITNVRKEVSSSAKPRTCRRPWQSHACHTHSMLNVHSCT